MASDPDDLARLLREALEAALTPDPLSPEQLEALREVARRHRGAPLDLDPVALDLLKAWLSRNLSGRVARGESLIRALGQSFLGNAESRRRLKRFWELLQESVEKEEAP